MTSVPDQPTLWETEPNPDNRRLNIPDDAHGKASTYTGMGCRCTACRQAMREYQTAYKRGERTCKNCRKRFIINQGEAGIKYCSTACKHAGYTVGYRPPGEAPPSKGEFTCRACWRPYNQHTKDHTRHNSYDLCFDCRDNLSTTTHSRFRQNGVPLWAVVHYLLVGTCMNPGCGRNLRAPIRVSGHKGFHSPMAIDHNHETCDSDRSCPKCFRGLICTPCNLGLGQLEDDPQRIAGLLHYLDQTRHG